MRVYYSSSVHEIIAEGFRRTFPERSLTALAIGASDVEIWLQADPALRLVGPVPHTDIKDEFNGGFADQAATIAYLTAEFAKQPDSHEDLGDLVLKFENALS